MPHEGYVDPITNDGPGFHSDVLVIKLTEHVTRAIEASDVSSTPLVAETTDGVTHETEPTPSKPNGAQALRTPNASPAAASAAPRSATSTPRVCLTRSLGCTRCLDPQLCLPDPWPASAAPDA